MKYFTAVVGLLLILFARPANAQVTYNKQIKPLLDAHCLSCHHKGCIGPMPLSNYKEVSAYGDMILQVTTLQRMPPWKADPHYSALKDVNALSTASVTLIKLWVDSGMKEGIPAKIAAPHKQPAHLSHADYTFAMKQRFTPKQGHTDYAQVFVIPTGLDSDIAIDALEFVPGNKRILKNCFISIDTSAQGELLDSYDPKYGYVNFGAYAFMPSSFIWYQWTPEDSIYVLPKGFVKRIPAHSKLLFYMNYMPSFDAQVPWDSSCLKVRIAKAEGKQQTIESVALIDTGNLNTPPFFVGRDERRQCMATLKIERPVTIHSIMPMGQLVCKSWEIYGINPKTQVQVPLLSIPEWDFAWRKKYTLATPITLPEGFELRAVAVYDNTDANTNIPILPTRPVHYGESKRLEMFTVAFDVSY